MSEQKTESDRRLTPEVIAGLRRDNEAAKRRGWRAEIGVDDVDLLLDAVTHSGGSTSMTGHTCCACFTHNSLPCCNSGHLTPTPDNTPEHGLSWRDGLDALNALLNDCAQVGADHENFVRVSAVRHIVNAVRRWEDDIDESIRAELWEDAVANGEPWALADDLIPPGVSND